MDALSAFSPDESWAITQAGVSAKHGFRSFGVSSTNENSWKELRLSINQSINQPIITISDYSD